MAERKREKIRLSAEDIAVVSATDLGLAPTNHVARRSHLWKFLFDGRAVCSKQDDTEWPSWLEGVDCEGCGAEVAREAVLRAVVEKSLDELCRWVIDLAWYESDAGRCNCPQCAVHRSTLAERAAATKGAE